MTGLIEKGLLLGLGVLTLTRDRVVEFVDRLVEEGEVTPEEAPGVVDRLVGRGEEERLVERADCLHPLSRVPSNVNGRGQRHGWKPHPGLRSVRRQPLFHSTLIAGHSLKRSNERRVAIDPGSGMQAASDLVEVALGDQELEAGRLERSSLEERPRHDVKQRG